MKEFPSCPTLMVCDMSSDIFSRKINVNNFDLIYAGAQKNMGPAGTTLVIVKDEILGKTERKIPTMLDYKTHIKKDSMFNTPPVFPIYVSMLNLQWLNSSSLLASFSKKQIFILERSSLLAVPVKRGFLSISAYNILAFC